MSLFNMMAQSATIYNKTGYNKFGRDQEGVGTVSRCRFQDSSKMLQLPNEQVVQLVGTFYFPPSVTIATDDRVVFSGSNYKAFSVNSAVDGHGNNRLTKVTVIKWQT